MDWMFSIVTRSWRGLGAATLILLGSSSHSLAQFSISEFSPGPSYALSAGPMLIGDFNGDGKSDGIHFLSNADYAYVWLSQGNGKFDVQKFSPWPGYPAPGVKLIGDFDGDEKSDVLHAVAGADYAHVWTSNGDGTFKVTTFRPWPEYPMTAGRMMIGDFNGNKRSDVFHAVADRAYIWASVPGSFEVKTFRPWDGYDMSRGAMLIGDFDGDGKSDVFHAIPGSDFSNIWYSNGDGTFDVQSFSPWPGYVMDTGTWLVGDFNGDGRADLLHVLPGKSSVDIWLSKGRGSFKVTNFLPWPDYPIEKGRWLVGDFDDDGYADVVHLLESEGRVNIWLSTGDGSFRISTFSPGPSYAISTGQWLTGDFNGDGSSNLLHGVEGTNYAKVWLSNFPSPLTATILICSLSTGIAFEDCDRSNAVHVIDVPERFYGPIMCMMRVQAYLAGTEIGRQSTTDERVKIVCHRRTHAQKPVSGNKTAK
jgi:FG-GAP-like repeat